MKRNKKITLSIGTSAYNEEHNITKMLNSVVVQKEKTFTIKEILVISDGSTDNTVKRAKSLKDKRIKIIDDGKRLGQPARIRSLLKIFRGEILVFIDSDMLIKNDTALEKMISLFKKNNKIGMVSGYTQPLPAKTFIESAINNFKSCRLSMEPIYSFQNLAFGAHAFFALSKKLAKSIQMPEENIGHDSYFYFSALKKGLKFQSNIDAVAYYRSPQTIKDYIKQNFRYYVGELQLRKYFGEEAVNKGYYVPIKIMLLLKLKQFFHNPLGYIYLVLVNCYLLIKIKVDKEEIIGVVWDPLESTKILG